MTGKNIGLVAAGVATGYIAALLIHSDSNTKTPLNGEGEGLSASQQSRPESESAESKGSSSFDRKQETAPPGAAPSSADIQKEILGSLDEAARKNYARALEEENAQLMAAGFSMARIKWLRERSEQLEAERRRADTDRRMQGLTTEVDLDYSGDNVDLDLRNEIGFEEYERYRKALGRQISVPVVSVLPGSIAETVGLKPGDQIKSYAGERVYSQQQIVKRDGRGTSGTRLILEVERDGVPMQFEVPAGVLGITSTMSLPSKSKIYKLGIDNAKK